jgi:hypothetical protein
MLGLTQPKRESIARNARRRVEADADWATIANAYARALTQVLA